MHSEMMVNKNNSAELPKGWIWTTLGAICLPPQYGWTTSAVASGKLKLLRTSDITSGQINWQSIPHCQKEPDEVKKYLLEDGDIVISRAGSVGYSVLMRKPEKAIFASYLIRFRPLTNANYVAYFLKSPLYWKSISEKKLGIAVPNVNASKLKQIEFPLPPLPEQHCIVVKIGELFTKLDAGIEALKKIKIQLKRYRQAVLKHAFEGKLTEEWRKTQNPAIPPLEKGDKGGFVDLPELPETWKWKRLGEIADIVSGNTPKKLNEASNKGNIPFYKVNDMNTSGNEVFMKKAKINLTVDEIREMKLRLFPKNTVIFPKRGGAILTNKKRILSQKSAFDLNLMGAIPKKPTNEVFLFFWFQNLDLGSIYDGSNVPQINHKDVDPLPFPVPPLFEQHQIASEIERRFSVADEIERTIDMSLHQADRLRQSILKRAFEGKLVPQDPNDEPAEKLLERIKAEKAKYDKEKLSKKIWKRKTRQKGENDAQ